MKKREIKKLCIAAVLCSIAVVGSLFSFPVFGSKCAPIQHLVNVFAAVLLGPVYGVVMAFVTSLIRYFAGLGSLLAFPGSMVGALLAGLTFKFIKRLLPTALAEVFGTGVLGGLLAYPVAILFMGKSTANIAFYAYIVPFLISTAVGSAIAYAILLVLDRCKLLEKFEGMLEN